MLFTRPQNIALKNLCSIVLAMALGGPLLSGCVGTRAAGALGGGDHAAMFVIPANYQTAWQALIEVLEEDPTLFNVGETSPPNAGAEGIVRGKKGSNDVTIWVQPHGKDSTSFEVQAGFLVVTDGPAQAGLAHAIGEAIEKKVSGKPKTSTSKRK